MIFELVCADGVMDSRPDLEFGKPSFSSSCIRYIQCENVTKVQIPIQDRLIGLIDLDFVGNLAL